MFIMLEDMVLLEDEEEEEEEEDIDMSIFVCLRKRGLSGGSMWLKVGGWRLKE